MKSDCIFYKIVNGEIDSAKIWEDNEFLAILDVMPNTKGMTLVLTKKHYDSYAFDIPEDVYLRLMSASKRVGKILERGLGVTRVVMVMEGMGINHAHIKLYPLHGVKEKFKEMWAKEKVFFDKYEGYITTQTGPKVDITELKKLAEELEIKYERPCQTQKISQKFWCYHTRTTAYKRLAPPKLPSATSLTTFKVEPY